MVKITVRIHIVAVCGKISRESVQAKLAWAKQGMWHVIEKIAVQISRQGLNRVKSLWTRMQSILCFMAVCKSVQRTRCDVLFYLPTCHLNVDAMCIH